MDIKFLFYGILCIIALIFLIRFGNKKSVLIKEENYYHKLISLKLRTRILIIILAWIFSAKWIITAYKYNYKGISILGRTCTNKLDMKFKINNLRNYILFDKV